LYQKLKWNKTIVKWKEVINRRYVLPDTFKVETVLKCSKRYCVKTLLKRFFNGRKTGTAAVNYAKDGGSGKYYASSFVGYFPADHPKYSCIVVVHKPSTVNNNIMVRM
jgi:cell division protein FtsI (penicillin-binding protein 3)